MAVVSQASFTSVSVETNILFHIVSVLVGNAVTIFWLTSASAIVAKNSKATAKHGSRDLLESTKQMQKIR